MSTSQRVSLISLLVSVFLSSTAMASKARLTALGLDENGSLLIEDDRGIFLNPAELAGKRNMVNMEFGSSTVPSTPNAEGGVQYNLESGTLAVQLGRESNFQGDITTINALAGAYDFLEPQNVVELMFASTAGFGAWGASLLYGNSADNATAGAFPNKSSNTITLRGGAIMGPLKPYVYLDLIRSSENENAAGNTATLDGSLGIGFGASYDTSATGRFFASVDLDGGEARDAGNNLSHDFSTTRLTAGYRFRKPIGKSAKSKAFIFGSAALLFQSGSVDDNTAATQTNNNITSLPIVIGVEAPVKKWFALRGSVAQNVLLQKIDDGDEDSNFPNSTTIGAGASIRFATFRFDATLAGVTTGTIDSDSLFANASMIANF